MRYHCTVCADYDLCRRCVAHVAQFHPAHHTFRSIPIPSHRVATDSMSLPPPTGPHRASLIAQPQPPQQQLQQQQQQQMQRPATDAHKQAQVSPSAIQSQGQPQRSPHRPHKATPPQKRPPRKFIASSPLANKDGHKQRRGTGGGSVAAGVITHPMRSEAAPARQTPRGSRRSFVIDLSDDDDDDDGDGDDDDDDDDANEEDAEVREGKPIEDNSAHARAVDAGASAGAGSGALGMPSGRALPCPNHDHSPAATLRSPCARSPHSPQSVGENRAESPATASSTTTATATATATVTTAAPPLRDGDHRIRGGSARFAKAHTQVTDSEQCPPGVPQIAAPSMAHRSGHSLSRTHAHVRGNIAAAPSTGTGMRAGTGVPHRVHPTHAPLTPHASTCVGADTVGAAPRHSHHILATAKADRVTAAILTALRGCAVVPKKCPAAGPSNSSCALTVSFSTHTRASFVLSTQVAVLCASTEIVEATASFQRVLARLHGLVPRYRSVVVVILVSPGHVRAQGCGVLCRVALYFGVLCCMLLCLVLCGGRSRERCSDCAHAVRVCLYVA